MDAIPRLTSIFDARIIISMVFYATLTKTILMNVNTLKNRLIPIINVQRRAARSKKKQLPPLVTTSSVQLQSSSSKHRSSSSSSNNNNSDCTCMICKQGLNLRHSSSCRAINNNNVPLPSVKCGCPPFRHSSPSPSSSSSISSSSSSSSTTSSSSSSPSSMKNTNSYNNHNIPPTAAAILLSIALLALPFLPATNLFFYVGFVVAERILYLPSVGYCLLVGLGVAKLMDRRVGLFKSQSKRYAMLCCIGMMLLALSIKTVHRNFDWRNEENLYRSAIRINPPKGK